MWPACVSGRPPWRTVGPVSRPPPGPSRLDPGNFTRPPGWFVREIFCPCNLGCAGEVAAFCRVVGSLLDRARSRRVGQLWRPFLALLDCPARQTSRRRSESRRKLVVRPAAGRSAHCGASRTVTGVGALAPTPDPDLKSCPGERSFSSCGLVAQDHWR